MAETSHEDVSSLDDQIARNRAAIGIVATDKNADRVAGAILRGRQHDHRTIVTARTPNCEALSFARSLGAVIVEPPTDWTDVESPKEKLAAVARARGHPGLLYHSQSCDRIDFQASNDALRGNDAFAIDARIDASVERQPTVVVGIPAYNESTTISSVVNGASEYADLVIVVDDGSDDGTAERAEEVGAVVIRHGTNRGYGVALQSIFEQAEKYRADHLVVLDGDGQHDVDDIPKLVETQQETESEIVIGSRFVADTNTEMPLYRRFGLGVINLLMNMSLGIVASESRIKDTQSGFRAYDRAAIESIDTDSSIDSHMNASIDILYHAHSNGYDIEEVPSTVDYDVTHGSSHNPFHHGMIVVMNVVRIIERERPITLLGIPGVLCAFAGFGFGYWTGYEYLQSGTFPIEGALVASILIITGMLTAFTAIILHSLAVYLD